MKKPPLVMRYLRLLAKRATMVAVICSLSGFVGGVVIGGYSRWAELKESRVMRAVSLASDMARRESYKSVQHLACARLMRKMIRASQSNTQRFLIFMIVKSPSDDNRSEWEAYLSLVREATVGNRENAEACLDGDRLHNNDQLRLAMAFASGNSDSNFRDFIDALSSEINTILSEYEFGFAPWRLGTTDRKVSCDFWTDWWRPIKTVSPPSMRPVIELLGALANPANETEREAAAFFPTLVWLVRDSTTFCGEGVA